MFRERYLKQLDLLKESVVSFGHMVEMAFRDSMDAVIDLDVKLAERTLAFDFAFKEARFLP
jgi:phosphate transport system protein